MEYFIQTIAVYAIPVIFAITLHEAAHGYVAKGLGDTTAYALGRVSLNPLRHIDPLGTIVVPAALFATTGFVFGWAKPVPVNYHALRQPKRDMMWVAAAGPAANAVMALGWALVFKLATLSGGATGDYLYEIGKAGIMVNVILMVLNLLPIPPLDGGRILVGLLPNRLAWSFARIEPFGFPILLLLLVTNALTVILTPMVLMSYQLIGVLFQL